jgi:hypothetical protein
MPDKDAKRYINALKEAESIMPLKFGAVFKPIKLGVENGEIPMSVAASTITNLIRTQNQRQSGRESGKAKAATNEFRNTLILSLAETYLTEKPSASHRQIAKQIPIRIRSKLEADDQITNEKDKLSTETRIAYEKIAKLSTETIRSLLKNNG